MKKLKMTFVFLLGLLILFMGTTAVFAGNKVVTTGSFHTFATGLERGYDIGGEAVMVRSAHGRTHTSVKVWGLAADSSYPTHVHNAPCNVNNGGGHYQNIVGGPVDSVNEIWPRVYTDGSGFGTGQARNEFIARPEAQSVVIHDLDGARIACADLQ